MWFASAFSVNINKIFSANIWWIIYRNLLKFSCIQDFCDKKWVVFSVRFFGNLKDDCVIKTIEIFNFPPLTSNSVTIEFRFLLLIVSAIYHQKLSNFYYLYQDCIHQYFCKHHAYLLNTQCKLRYHQNDLCLLFQIC